MVEDTGGHREPRRKRLIWLAPLRTSPLNVARCSNARCAQRRIFAPAGSADAGIAGGRQRDVTFGANRHLTSHFKFQANYVHVLDEKRGAYSASDAAELRAQLQF